MPEVLIFLNLWKKFLTHPSNFFLKFDFDSLRVLNNPTSENIGESISTSYLEKQDKNRRVGSLFVDYVMNLSIFKLPAQTQTVFWFTILNWV